MKRSGSNESQTNNLESIKLTSAPRSQRLLNVERSYYYCRARVVKEVSNMTPHNPSAHAQLTASLQELITLGLDYRHAEALHATAQIANTVSPEQVETESPPNADEDSETWHQTRSPTPGDFGHHSGTRLGQFKERFFHRGAEEVPPLSVTERSGEMRAGMPGNTPCGEELER